MASITLTDIVKKYGDGYPAVNGVSLDIKDGEFVILVGPSGCGKSTLLRMIVGLEDITSGELKIGDEVVNEKAPRDRHLAMVFQNYALYPHLTVFENIAFPLRLQKGKFTEEQIKDNVEFAADTLELREHLDRKPANLSGGQRQRVAMGRAIVRDARAFLFDEPLSNLDAKLRVAMRLEIMKLHRRLGTTSLYVTHDQVEAMTLAHRMIVMYQGVPEQIGTPMEVFEKPASTFVAGFIGSPPMNLMEVQVSGDGTVQTADGNQLEISPLQVPSQVRGRKVIMGMRPEHMLLNTQGIPAEVEMVETLGSEQLVHCRCGKSTLVVRCTTRQLSESSAKVGMQVNVGPDGRHALHWFEADTGRRVQGL